MKLLKEAVVSLLPCEIFNVVVFAVATWAMPSPGQNFKAVVDVGPATNATAYEVYAAPTNQPPAGVFVGGCTAPANEIPFSVSQVSSAVPSQAYGSPVFLFVKAKYGQTYSPATPGVYFDQASYAPPATNAATSLPAPNGFTIVPSQ